MDVSECDHLPGTAYLVPGGPADLGWCRVCCKAECDHLPTKTYGVSLVSMIQEMELDEVSIVTKPAHLEARIHAVSIPVADLRAVLGTEVAMGGVLVVALSRTNAQAVRFEVTHASLPVPIDPNTTVPLTAVPQTATSEVDPLPTTTVPAVRPTNRPTTTATTTTIVSASSTTSSTIDPRVAAYSGTYSSYRRRLSEIVAGITGDNFSEKCAEVLSYVDEYASDVTAPPDRALSGLASNEISETRTSFRMCGQQGTGPQDQQGNRVRDARNKVAARLYEIGGSYDGG